MLVCGFFLYTAGVFDNVVYAQYCGPPDNPGYFACRDSMPQCDKDPLGNGSATWATMVPPSDPEFLNCPNGGCPGQICYKVQTCSGCPHGNECSWACLEENDADLISVGGYVLDCQGDGVQDVEIEIWDISYNEIEYTTTDSTGHFEHDSVVRRGSFYQIRKKPGSVLPDRSGDGCTNNIVTDGSGDTSSTVPPGRIPFTLDWGLDTGVGPPEDTPFGASYYGGQIRSYGGSNGYDCSGAWLGVVDEHRCNFVYEGGDGVPSGSITSSDPDNIITLGDPITFTAYGNANGENDIMRATISFCSGSVCSSGTQIKRCDYSPLQNSVVCVADPYTFLSPGTYTAYVGVLDYGTDGTDGQWCAGRTGLPECGPNDSVTVQVNAPANNFPTGDISASDTDIILGETVTFTAHGYANGEADLDRVVVEFCAGTSCSGVGTRIETCSSSATNTITCVSDPPYEFGSGGTFTVFVGVKDTAGQWCTGRTDTASCGLNDTVLINVTVPENERPYGRMMTPTVDQTVSSGGTLQLQIRGNDSTTDGSNVLDLVQMKIRKYNLPSEPLPGWDGSPTILENDTNCDSDVCYYPSVLGNNYTWTAPVLQPTDNPAHYWVYMRAEDTGLLVCDSYPGADPNNPTPNPVSDCQVGPVARIRITVNPPAPPVNQKPYGNFTTINTADLHVPSGGTFTTRARGLDPVTDDPDVLDNVWARIYEFNTDGWIEPYLQFGNNTTCNTNTCHAPATDYTWTAPTIPAGGTARTYWLYMRAEDDGGLNCNSSPGDPNAPIANTCVPESGTVFSRIKVTVDAPPLANERPTGMLITPDTDQTIVSGQTVNMQIRGIDPADSNTLDYVEMKIRKYITSGPDAGWDGSATIYLNDNCSTDICNYPEIYGNNFVWNSPILQPGDDPAHYWLYMRAVDTAGSACHSYPGDPNNPNVPVPCDEFPANNPPVDKIRITVNPPTNEPPIGSINFVNPPAPDPRVITVNASAPAIPMTMTATDPDSDPIERTVFRYCDTSASGCSAHSDYIHLKTCMNSGTCDYSFLPSSYAPGTYIVAMRAVDNTPQLLDCVGYPGTTDVRCDRTAPQIDDYLTVIINNAPPEADIYFNGEPDPTIRTKPFGFDTVNFDVKGWDSDNTSPLPGGVTLYKCNLTGSLSGCTNFAEYGVIGSTTLNGGTQLLSHTFDANGTFIIAVGATDSEAASCHPSKLLPPASYNYCARNVNGGNPPLWDFLTVDVIEPVVTVSGETKSSNVCGPAFASITSNDVQGGILAFRPQFYEGGYLSGGAVRSGSWTGSGVDDYLISNVATNVDGSLCMSTGIMAGITPGTEYHVRCIANQAVTPVPGGVVCAPAQINSGAGITANFNFETIYNPPNPWISVSDGDVYGGAGGNGILAQVPSGGVAAGFSPYLAWTGTAPTESSAFAGWMDIGNTDNQISEDDTYLKNLQPSLWFDDFRFTPPTNAQLVPSQVDFLNNLNPSNVYYATRTNIQTYLNSGNPTSYRLAQNGTVVVYVTGTPGTLAINRRVLSLAPNSQRILLVIPNGITVNFAASQGSAASSPTNPDYHLGIISAANINFLTRAPNPDFPVVVDGPIITNGEVFLNRDLDDNNPGNGSENALKPAESFVYEPLYLTGISDTSGLKISDVTWIVGD